MTHAGIIRTYSITVWNLLLVRWIVKAFRRCCHASWPLDGCWSGFVL